jgi:PAS domain S-box-containing protein
MKRVKFSTEQLAGLFVGTLGAVVLLRWLFDIEWIAGLLPGAQFMGFNTPALFLLAGLCSFGALQVRAPLPVLTRLAGAVLVLLPMLVLAEHVFGLSLGVDVAKSGALPSPSLPHPGRMAPNTCIGFLLAGVAFELARSHHPSRARDWLLATCSASVLLIGFGALAGYVLRLEGLYRVAASNSMALPTAVGMAALGTGLWAIRAGLAQRSASALARNDERITARAIMVVTIVALCGGAIGFAAMRDSYEQTILDKMRGAATSSADSILNALESSVALPRATAQAPGQRRAIELAATGADAHAWDELDRIGAAYLAGGVSAVRFTGPDGKVLSSRGSFQIDQAEVRHSVRLNGHPATLLWRDGYLLYVEAQVRDGEKLVGTIATEQRLPLVDRIIAGVRALTPSSDLLLCDRAGADASCAPSRFYAKPFLIPMHKPDGSVNLPINHALLGESGVSVTADLRGIPVFASYTPLRDSGLGLVVKSNVDTLYTPLRERSDVLVLALVVLVVVGASALLIQVRPLLAQLVSEQRRTRVILENSSDAFVALGVDGRITDWNTAAENTFGWSAAEAVGRKVSELIVPQEQRAAHDAGFARFIGSGTGPVINQRLEVHALRKDGQLIPIELAIAAYHNGEGYVANAFMRDITERRRLTGELEARAEELEHERDRAQAANRAKGEFVANMSHELRTPMNAVLGMAHLLGHTELKTEQKKYVDMISSSGQSLLGIMNDILDFSKVEAGKMELSETRFRLDDVLGAVAGIMAMSAGEKDLDLAIVVEAGVPQALLGDALRVQQVLVNLAGNAIKFTERGEVRIVVELAAREAGLATLRVRVRDTGIGMDPAQQARLFSAFTQADSSTTRRFGGTGLGLTISRKLAELMGGAIGFDSAPGQGSEFCLTLPLRLDTEAEEGARRGTGLGALQLLVVDDSEGTRASLARSAASFGWQCDCAADADTALALAGERQYDVVLADAALPSMDGIRLGRAVRATQQGRRVPLLLLANALGRSRLQADPAAAEAAAVLSKPVTAPALYETVRDALQARPGAELVLHQVRSGPRLDGVRLLLAEDNELNQMVACTILERAGASVDVVGNGELAVARLAAQRGAYDLVLMDIQMPVMDGYEATQRIRAELGLKLPVLAMTAGVTESERTECIDAGMDGLIAKPLDVEDMLSKIARFAPGALRMSLTEPAAMPVTAPTPAQDELPVLRLEPLLAVSRGNPQQLAGFARLLSQATTRAEAEFAAAQAHFSSGRGEEAARVLHGMRGGIGSLGAKRFAAASLRLEQAIKAGDAGAVAMFAAVQADLAAAMDAARAWLATQPPL